MTAKFEKVATALDNTARTGADMTAFDMLAYYPAVVIGAAVIATLYTMARR